MTEVKVIVDDEGQDVEAVFEEHIEVGSEGGGGLSEEEVKEIVTETTKDLQPKKDESLPTESKEIVGAIKELYEREDKQGLSEDQVKDIVQQTAVTKEADPTVPDWAKKEEKPEYKYEEIKEKPTLVEGVSADIQEQTFIIKLEDKEGNEIARTQVTLPKAEIPDLSEYVKNTDYAKDNQCGVVQTSLYRGIQTVSKGLLIVRQPKDDYIDNRNNGTDQATTFAVTLSKFDYALRKAFTDGQLTLPDVEQAKWRGMIGATKLYMHSMTDANGEIITLIDTSSAQKTPLEMIEAFHGNNVVHRNYKGNTIVRTTLFIAGMSAIQIEYLIYSTVTGISGSSITLDLSNSTDIVTEL